MPRGKFITLEGGEGAGKSTQAKQLFTYLNERGIEVVQTREVGGCPSAETIRAVWLGQTENYWEPLTELLLISAARAEHLIKVIQPALERGAWVVSDRFIDSTRAYQGLTLGLGLARTDQIYSEISDLQPDLTLLLDLPIEVGMNRMQSRGGQHDRFERKPPSFHQTLRDAYLSLASAEPQRIKTISAALPAAQVADAIHAAVAAQFGLA